MVKQTEYDCPYLRVGLVIPFRNMKYNYCALRRIHANSLRSLDDAMLNAYCQNENEIEAFTKCPLWQDFHDKMNDNT